MQTPAESAGVFLRVAYCRLAAKVFLLAKEFVRSGFSGRIRDR